MRFDSIRFGSIPVQVYFLDPLVTSCLLNSTISLISLRISFRIRITLSPLPMQQARNLTLAALHSLTVSSFSCRKCSTSLGSSGYAGKQPTNIPNFTVPLLVLYNRYLIAAHAESFLPLRNFRSLDNLNIFTIQKSSLFLTF